ncbi:hypothetical protein, partial [uncultured Clostridium sp.]|uniref:hypothetical protein n=1 Tax=uncultured Clostridium sp. TaxID=59620 RepID=UPI0025FE9817
MEQIDEIIKKELLDYFVDKNATGIYKNKKLNNKVNRRINELNIVKKEYLAKLGFIYSTEDWGEKVTEENIKLYLEKLYPNKYISKVSDILKKKQKVYIFINDYCTKNGISSIEYLFKLGFNVGNSYLKDNSFNDINIDNDICISKSFLFNPLANRNKYNISLINQLKENFNVKISYIAKLLGVTRQIIDQQIKSNDILSSVTLDEEDFEDEIQELIINMISNFEVEYVSEEINIKFYFGKGIAILYDYHGDKKCVINPDGVIGDLLTSKGYHKYNENDIHLMNRLGACNKIKYFGRWNGEKDRCRIEDTELKNIINVNKKKHNMAIDDYYSFIGLKYYNIENEIEDRLYKIFKKNLDSDGIVKIPIHLNNGKQNPEYVKVFKDLNSLKISKEALIDKFGFNYKRIVNRERIEDKYRKIIIERYVVYENKIYINSQDKFYINLHSTARIKGITLDEYVKKLGFIRLNRNQLPDGYIEYNWHRDN